MNDPLAINIVMKKIDELYKRESQYSSSKNKISA